MYVNISVLYILLKVGTTALLVIILSILLLSGLVYNIERMNRTDTHPEK